MLNRDAIGNQDGLVKWLDKERLWTAFGDLRTAAEAYRATTKSENYRKWRGKINNQTKENQKVAAQINNKSGVSNPISMTDIDKHQQSYKTFNKDRLIAWLNEKQYWNRFSSVSEANRGYRLEMGIKYNK